MDEHPRPTVHRFASGLDEVLGLAHRDGAFYATHATEVTRITDANGDGRADRFDTVSDKWGFGHYHEFALGSKFDAAGNLYVALGLSESYNSKALFRGWALKITPDGKTVPLCSGLRSPLGVGENEHGEMFYVEPGAVERRVFAEASQARRLYGTPRQFQLVSVRAEHGAGAGQAEHALAHGSGAQAREGTRALRRGVPYKKMGRSISAFEVNRSGGKFGPFENQMFVGDYTLSIVMRVTTELINGVWQGACYPFREGLGMGILAVHFTPRGQLVAGGTNRGWPVRGMKDNLLQRLDWTGKMPFEILDIRAQSDGFSVRFTQPVDSALASRPESYELQTYTHIYQQGYGSPEVDHTRPTVTTAEVAPDGMSARLRVKGLVQGHVHDFHLPALKSRDGEPLLHDRAYYTLNEIPKH